MKRKTHKRIVKTIFPKFDARMADRVNKAIDTPKPGMPAYSPSYGQVPGLSHRGHRKYGHDILTAGVVGFREGGLDGVAVAAMHLLTDAMRDKVVDTYGGELADIVEALLIYAIAPKKRGRKRRR